MPENRISPSVVYEYIVGLDICSLGFSETPGREAIAYLYVHSHLHEAPSMLQVCALRRTGVLFDSESS
jgi:hypothetical protein